MGKWSKDLNSTSQKNICYVGSPYNASSKLRPFNNYTRTTGVIQDWPRQIPYMMHPTQVTSNTYKDISPHRSFPKCKLRLQWDTSTHPSEWLKRKKLIIPTVSKGEDIEQVELSCTAGVVQTEIIVLKNSWGVSTKVKHLCLMHQFNSQIHT